MKVALRIEVGTRHGAMEGVPRLMEMLARHQARATFFIALGPDRMFHRSWLPGSELGRRCAALYRSVHDAGFEVGVQSYDPACWLAGVAAGDAAWTRSQMESACEAYLRIFDVYPPAHAASGWRMNRHAYRLTQHLGFRYASDMRGQSLFIPVRNAELIACPQLPTTLPMLEELTATNDAAGEDPVQRLLEMTRRHTQANHVFALRADREGTRFAPLFDALLAGWRAQGCALIALEDCMRDINIARLPRHNVVEGTVPGRRRPVALQGEEFLR